MKKIRSSQLYLLHKFEILNLMEVLLVKKYDIILLKIYISLFFFSIFSHFLMIKLKTVQNVSTNGNNHNEKNIKGLSEMRGITNYYQKFLYLS